MKESEKLNYQVFLIKKEQTLRQFCREYSLIEAFCIAESENLKAGDRVIALNLNKKIHIVLPLESLESIAEKYNVSVQYIKSTNKIDKIFIGQQLFI